jgi:hypothetical protein
VDQTTAPVRSATIIYRLDGPPGTAFSGLVSQLAGQGWVESPMPRRRDDGTLLAHVARDGAECLVAASEQGDEALMAVIRRDPDRNP